MRNVDYINKIRMFDKDQLKREMIDAVKSLSEDGEGSDLELLAVSLLELVYQAPTKTNEAFMNYCQAKDDEARSSIFGKWEPDEEDIGGFIKHFQ